MSEELELNDNLCTTVDAFEKFQAITMYEQNEYIVLSDISPAQHTNQDTPEEGNVKIETPHNSGIMLSNSDDDQHVNTSEKRTDELGTKKKFTELPAKHAVYPETAENNMTNIYTNENLTTTSKSLKTEHAESIQDIQDFIKNTEVSTPIKTYARKPKHSENKVGDISVKPTQSSLISPTSTLELITTIKYDDSVSNETNKICKKRGRPRKQTLEEKELSDAEIINDLDILLSSEDIVDRTSTTFPWKQGKGKKMPKEDDTSKKPDAEIVKPHTKTNTLEITELKILPESIQKKTTPKRRKQKRNSSEVITKQLDSQLSIDNVKSINESDFDNEDDVCLSKLNKSKNDMLGIDTTSEEISVKTALSTMFENIEYNSPTVDKLNKKSSENLSEDKSIDLNSSICESEAKVSTNNSSDNVTQIEDEEDDICLSKMKKTKKILSQNKTNGNFQTPNKRNSKRAIMSDFEYNIDSIISDNVCHDESQSSDKISQLAEDGSKRSGRRKTKQPLHYAEGSDEDPFANVELSDDEAFKGKKSRYYSDDEYIPGRKQGGNTCTESSDSEPNVTDNQTQKIKRKKMLKKADSTTPKKRGKKSNTEMVVDVDDIEECLEPSHMKTNDEQNSQPNTWGSTNEFENFLAMKIQGTNLKIKKVSSNVNAEGIRTPLQIPTINPNEPKKTIEMSSQTNSVATSVAAVQTSARYDIPLKENVPLTSEQSKKACEFLKSIVKTTAELGQLMTHKSNDFIKKKINVENVTDTSKTDYCVKKTFLLLKLAKHNLTQMEEDLAEQYELFLNENKLTHCREAPIELVPTVKDSDSDCEIVDEPVTPIKSQKETDTLKKFNPKTVFLNKELSIKIAKKPNEEKKLNIKGKHTVWINDSVMVKKVKPTQSFLAQDSRNKKPPDHKYVTLDMVSDFFDKYNYQKMLTICDQFTSQDWLTLNMDCICNYFVIKPDINDSDNQNVTVVEECAVHTTEHIEVISDINPKVNAMKNAIVFNEIFNPQTLLTLCVQTLQNHIYIQRSDFIASHNEQGTYQLADGKLRREPETLISLSLKILSDTYLYTAEEDSVKKVILNVCSPVTLPSLTQLCYKRIKTLLFEKDFSLEPLHHYNVDENFRHNNYMEKIIDNNNNPDNLSETQNDVIEIKSLFTLCVNFIQKILHEDNTSSICSNSNRCRNLSPKTLKYITYKNIVYYLNINNTDIYNEQAMCSYVQDVFTNIPEDNKEISEFFNINSVNTLSEEAFLNLNTVSIDMEDNFEDYENYEDDNSIFTNHEFENDVHDTERNLLEATNWVSQVQMNELKSGITLSTQNSDGNKDSEEVEKEVSVQVKLEPSEEISSNIVDVSIVKTEYIPGLDEMTIIPENVIPKSEIPECSDSMNECILNCNSSSYDATVFENFLSSNKLITSQSIYEDSEVFSQSVLRVSGFHEPDYDSELVSELDSLLIPQTYKSLNVENAKNCLMESNSDDNSITKTERKKIDKRKVKRKALKVSNKNALPIIKEPDKSQSIDEVATMTTRMRDKIRQKAKELITSDSEVEGDLNMNFKKTKPAVVANDSEIQCNDVDSTEKIIENCRTALSNDELFKDSDGPDQTEFSLNSNLLTDKNSLNILEKETRSEGTAQNTINTAKESISSVINYDSPVELLECEPTMPIFDDIMSSTSIENSTNSIDPRPKSFSNDIQDSVNVNNDNTEFIVRHGWKCYRIDCNDSKLIQSVKIILDKLPETFVNTYNKYQDIMDGHEEDLEIERLTNLNSLRKSIRDNKTNTKTCKVITEQEKLECVPSELDDQEVNDNESENYDELTPSEDEDTKMDDQPLSLLPLKIPENNLAKDSLMNDNDSDDGINIDKIKEESPDKTSDVRPKRQAGPKSKMNSTVTDNTELMLTADKVMNKELMLLNGPVTFNSDAFVTNKDTAMKKKQKTPPTRAYLTRERIKIEKEAEDYSSEEEKRWFNTKEKLLKITDKRDNASVSDAKHAKLVSEFIERRGDKTRKRKIFKCRRSRKKLLEQQKQLSVLYKELYGEPLESVTDVQSYGQRYTKGQRNSGKVTGKKYQKSKNELAYPILFEESERTKRLHARQAQLRQLLGCEENETVQVIEDKVCLEYDFETRKPVVSVHAFFTEVMKEHQYAGVKFMWDACFESLADIERGHLGSGCILAHCMGLGKTLQVLALLHTVMTHPRVGMRRVLVCCPLSTVLNWVDEIHKWIGPVTDQIKVFELSKLKKTYQRAYQLEDWFKGGGIFIIGYELFRSLTTLDPLLDDVRPNVIHKIRSALLDPGPDIIVCDEGHLLKNDYSILTMAMSRVTTKRRIVLTGTPMQNNLREYYCMVNFIKPNLLGTYTEFYKRFENPIINGQHRDSTEEDTRLMNSCTYILHKVLEGCLQRHEVSVMYPYLPKKHEYTVFITLTKYQWDMYKHYMYSYAKETKQNVLKDFHILQKIWSHPQVLHNFQTKSLMNKEKMKVEKLEDDLAQEDLAADMKPPAAESWWLQYLDGGEMLESIESSNKFLAVFRILKECVDIGNKVLIFSTSLFTLDSLEYFLKKINSWSLGQEYYRLDGSVPPEVRQKWCREFNAENNFKTKVFLISTRAGCLGLNMTAANRVIILDTSWNPAHDIQSIFRVYRFGQKRDCFIYRLVAMGTMEQKIYERSVTKQAVACRVLDEQLIDRHYNSADLNELYLYDETGMTVPGGVSVGVADAVILRVARDAPIHAVHEHDSLLRGTSEQGLPEHERTAAWDKFQQEHATKKMINKIAITKAQKQLKLSKESESTALDCTNVEARQEDIADNEVKLGSKPLIPVVSRGRKPVATNCYIPIKKDEEPGPSSQTIVALRDSTLEDIMVKKISTILMRHNFYNEGEIKIAELVTKVRNIIARGGNGVEKNGDDELSNSIADILLQREMSIPILTDIMCESINNTFNVTSSDEENKGSKRRSENAAEESANLSDVSNELDNGKRKKRKAALAPEKSLELNVRDDCDLYLPSNEINHFNRRSKRLETSPENSLNSCKLNSKTADTRKDGGKSLTQSNLIVEEIQAISEKEINKNQVCLENGYNRKRKSVVDDAQSIIDTQNHNVNNNDQSSVLNDGRRKVRRVQVPDRPNDPEPKKLLIDLTETLENEDDNGNKGIVVPIAEVATDVIIDLTEKPDSDYESAVKKSKIVNPKNYKETEQQKQSDVNDSGINLKSNNRKRTEDKGPIPLHPSILKNENFMNIVAHKYLKDNPMMTYEVAILAARHNINAARKMCESGKMIYSGDIYDKAVEILGKETLNELHTMGIVTESTQVVKPTLDAHARTGESSKDALPKPPDTNTKLKSQDTPVGSFKVFQMRSNVGGRKAATTATHPQQINSDVVPVGLFKGPAKIPASENFQQDVDCTFDLVDEDEDECILPDDDSVGSSPPMKIVSQRNPDTTPSTSSTKVRAQAVPASDRSITVTRPTVTVPCKVTSGPKSSGAITQPFTDVNIRSLIMRKTNKPISTTSPLTANKVVPADKDVVVILSDDEDPPTVASSTIHPPVVRPTDGGPIPVALTTAGDTHKSTPKLTLIRGRNSWTKSQSTPKLSSAVANNDVAETSLPIYNRVQQAPVSPVVNSSRVHRIASTTKGPIILRKPASRLQSRKSVDPDKPPQEKPILQKITASEVNTTQISPRCITSQSVPNTGQSVFNNIVHIQAPEYQQNSIVTEAGVQIKQNQLIKPINVVKRNTDTPSTSSDVESDLTKQHYRIVKLLETSEPPTKMHTRNSTKKCEPLRKILTKSNIIIDLTDETTTSDKTGLGSANELSKSTTYNGPKNVTPINKTFDKMFKNIILKKKDTNRSSGTNESVTKKNCCL